MSEIQQQIADGARPLARVGDVIAHGEAVPANATALNDVNGYTWEHRPTGWWGPRAQSLPGYMLVEKFAPLDVIAVREVVEVDPEPQPAEPPMWQLPRAHCYTSADHSPHAWKDADEPVVCWGEPAQDPRPAVPAGSGPVVLSLPQVPDGAVALVGNKTGQRFTIDPEEVGRAVWTNGSLSRWTLASLIDQEGGEGVTVEFAPPREPRTWPKLDAAPDIDDLPTAVDLIERDRSPLRFVLTTGLRGVLRYIEPGHPDCSFTLAELRQLGEVREVLS